MKKKRINLYKPAGFFGLIAFSIFMLVIITLFRIDGEFRFGELSKYVYAHSDLLFYSFCYSMILSGALVIIQSLFPSNVKNETGKIILAKKYGRHDCVEIEPDTEMENVEGIKIDGSVFQVQSGSHVIVSEDGKVVFESLIEKFFYLTGINTLKKTINETWNALFYSNYESDGHFHVPEDYNDKNPAVRNKSFIVNMNSPLITEIVFLLFVFILLIDNMASNSSNVNANIVRFNDFIWKYLYVVLNIIFLAAVPLLALQFLFPPKVTNKTGNVIKVKRYDRFDYYELEPGCDMSDVEGVKVNGEVYKIIKGSHVVVTEKGKIVVKSLFFNLFYLFGCFRKKKSPNENWDALFNA